MVDNVDKETSNERAAALFQQRLLASQEVLGSALGEESVLVSLESQRYFGLDEVATRFWQVLTEAPTIGAAYQTLLDEYEVSPEELEQDLVRFVEALLDQGLATLAHAG